MPGSGPTLICVPVSPQVQLDNLPGMSLMAGKALSSARMSDAVLSQSSLMASQQLRDRESEGKELAGCRRGVGTAGLRVGSCKDLRCSDSLHCKATSAASELCRAAGVEGLAATVGSKPFRAVCVS